jgi:hypothetical protein
MLFNFHVSCSLILGITSATVTRVFALVLHTEHGNVSHVLVLVANSSHVFHMKWFSVLLPVCLFCCDLSCISIVFFLKLIEADSGEVLKWWSWITYLLIAVLCWMKITRFSWQCMHWSFIWICSYSGIAMFLDTWGV